ncbi:MAG TPA: type II secretion system F family protein [Eubacteriales bacterium]|nr:type II secretion system F family protein [Eubacteriales bacterium]
MMKMIVVAVSGVAAFFVFYLLAMLRTRSARAMDTRLKALFETGAESVGTRRARNKRERVRLRRLDRIADELYVAGVALRAEEFITIWVVTGAIIPASALFLGAPTSLSIGMVIVGAAAPIAFVTIKRNRRLNLLGKQLSDALNIIVNALRAGLSFQTALKNVADEMEEPISREFMRVYRETQLGMPLENSLNRLVQRTANQDLELVCSAVVIQRQIGGNLAVILENISETIDQRIKLRGEIKTMTAAGTLSGYIIGALPVFIVVLLMFINPGYIDMFFTTETGRIMLMISVVLEAIGFSIVRKIVNIKL